MTSSSSSVRIKAPIFRVYFTITVNSVVTLRFCGKQKNSQIACTAIKPAKSTEKYLSEPTKSVTIQLYSLFQGVFPRNNGECTPALRLKRWQGETVAHTIMYSRVLNLHQPKKSLPQKCMYIMSSLCCCCFPYNKVPVLHCR